MTIYIESAGLTSGSPPTPKSLTMDSSSSGHMETLNLQKLPSGATETSTASPGEVYMSGCAFDAYEGQSAGTYGCLLYTSDAADDLLCVDLGGRRIIKQKKI